MLAVEIYHEFLKVVDFVHVGRLVLHTEVVASLSFQAEILAHEFIKSLLF